MNELEHHGILGQKWGVRRSQKELDRLAGRIGSNNDASQRWQAKANIVQDRNKELADRYRSHAKAEYEKATLRANMYDAKQAGRKETDYLTTKELQDLVTRLQLERRYREITESPTFKDTMKKTLKDAAVASIKGVAIAEITSLLKGVAGSAESKIKDKNKTGSGS